uniref:Uncharacterized protein n=1 Tax=Sphaeramia orbicularis TaxID=375764 RepID=A0A673BGD9_9TELE
MFYLNKAFIITSTCITLTLPAYKVHELVQRCRQARDMAYCPYSRFPVGAAVLTAGGTSSQVTDPRDPPHPPDTTKTLKNTDRCLLRLTNELYLNFGWYSCDHILSSIAVVFLMVCF